MPAYFPCAICGSVLNGSTFHYQKHMTQSHWAGTSILPLPSIYTSANTCPTLTLITGYWYSINPTNDPATARYSPQYTGAAWIQRISNTSADPFVSQPGQIQNNWPPASLSTYSSDSSSACGSPCEKVLASKLARRVATSSRKRKRSDSAGWSKRAAQQGCVEDDGSSIRCH